VKVGAAGARPFTETENGPDNPPTGTIATMLVSAPTHCRGVAVPSETVLLPWLAPNPPPVIAPVYLLPR